MLLVIGGGSHGIGMEPLYEDPRIRLVSLDIYRTEKTDLVADAHALPLADGSVDGVWAQYVLEHVLDPWAVVAEIQRVSRTEGLVYAETPFLQQVHEGAYDFTRFTAGGHRWLFRSYEEIDAGVSMGPGLQWLWTIEHAARCLSRSVTVGKLVKCAMFWVRYLDRLAPARYARDTASSFYFLGRRSDHELTPGEMVDYRG